jgi:hypothetical protein
MSKIQLMNIEQKGKKDPGEKKETGNCIGIIRKRL